MAMIKKLLDLLRRREYVSKEYKKFTDSDLKRELEKRERRVDNDLNLLRRKNMEIQALREVMEENGGLYTESEISSLFNSIMGETEKH